MKDFGQRMAMYSARQKAYRELARAETGYHRLVTLVAALVGGALICAMWSPKGFVLAVVAVLIVKVSGVMMIGRWAEVEIARVKEATQRHSEEP